MQDDNAAPVTLNRALTPIGVMLLAFSALSPVYSFYIGGDVVLHFAGSGAAIAFLAGGVASAILSLLYAEVGAAFPGAGGVYPSLAGVLGPMLTFPYIVLMAPLALAGTALSAVGLADYVRVLFPSLGLLPVAYGGLVLATMVALLNIRLGAIFTGIFLAVEVLALAAICVVALSHPHRGLGELLAHPVMLSHGALTPVPLFTLGLAAVSGLWATGGAGWALYFGEEMVEAKRKIGRVIAWTGAIAALTIAVPMILMLMSAQDLKATLAAEAPMAAFLRVTAGPVLANLVSLGVIAAIFNSLIACMIAYSRYIYSTGRDGVWTPGLNRLLSGLHPRFQSPTAATLVLAVFAGLSILFGEKALLILISANVFDYILMAFAVIVGRRRGQLGQDFRTPLHPLVPIFSLVVTSLSVIADWLDPEAGRPSTVLLWSLFIGALVYYHFRLRRASQAWRMAVEEA